MHSFTLITHPGRAAALVAAVGLTFGAQSALTLGGSGSAGYASTAALLAALGTAIVAVGIFAPLHSRSGSVAVIAARTGLALAFVPVVGSSLTAWLPWLPLLLGALGVAAFGMTWLVLARRQEGDIPPRLLAIAFAATLVGIVLAPIGGCLLAGTAWIAVGTALWSAYAAPSPGRAAPAAT